MPHKYYEAMFTDAIRKLQEKYGSRKMYEKAENSSRENKELSEAEAQFIQKRDSFYMATVTETGWPYVQHRGGKPGFIKVLSPNAIAFADYAGNRQYISVGNLQDETRVSLIMVDYPNQARLKIAGKAKIINEEDPVFNQAIDSDYKAKVERVIVIEVMGFDWNCPQHITPRFTIEEIESITNQP